MKAIVQTSYGDPDVLSLVDVDNPVAGPGEVVVGVAAAGINFSDWHLMTGTPYLVRLQAGLRRPSRTIPGADVAGTVVEVGPDVVDLSPGDRVFGWASGGAIAERVAVPADQLTTIPDGVPVESAGAVVIAGMTALQALRDKGGVRPGDEVLINGASGGVGTFAVQLATAMGANVTAVCSSATVETAARLGAIRVIDYTTTDVAQSGLEFDVMLDVPGDRPLAECRRLLNRTGTYVLIGGPKRPLLGPIPRLLRALVYARFVSQRFVAFVSKETPEDLAILRQHLASGAVETVIDRTYPLADAAEAFRYLGEGHARGKVVITIS